MRIFLIILLFISFFCIIHQNTALSSSAETHQAIIIFKWTNQPLPPPPQIAPPQNSTGSFPNPPYNPPLTFEHNLTLLYDPESDCLWINFNCPTVCPFWIPDQDSECNNFVIYLDIVEPDGVLFKPDYIIPNISGIYEVKNSDFSFSPPVISYGNKMLSMETCNRTGFFIQRISTLPGILKNSYFVDVTFGISLAFEANIDQCIHQNIPNLSTVWTWELSNIICKNTTILNNCSTPINISQTNTTTPSSVNQFNISSCVNSSTIICEPNKTYGEITNLDHLPINATIICERTPEMPPIFNFACYMDDCGICNGKNMDMDDCGVCFGNNNQMNRCGTCGGDPNEDCPGAVLTYENFDLSALNIDLFQYPISSISSLGDLNGDTYPDYIIGFPTYLNGSIIVVYTGPANHSSICFKIYSALDFLRDPLVDTFSMGYFVDSVGYLDQYNVTVVVVGAPYAFSGHGRIYVFYLDNNGNLLNYTVIADQLTRNFGRSFALMLLNSPTYPTYPLILTPSYCNVSTNYSTSKNTTNNSTSPVVDNCLLATLIGVEERNRKEMVRGIIPLQSIDPSLRVKSVHTIGDLDKDKRNEIAINSLFLSNNTNIIVIAFLTDDAMVKSFWSFGDPGQDLYADLLGTPNKREYMFFNCTEKDNEEMGDRNREREIRAAEKMPQKELSYRGWASSIIPLPDLNGDTIPEVAISNPKFNNNEGAIYIIFLNKTGSIDYYVIRPLTGNFRLKTTDLGIALTKPIGHPPKAYMVAVSQTGIYFLYLLEKNNTRSDINTTMPVNPEPFEDEPEVDPNNNTTSVLSWSELTEIPTEPIEVDYPYNNPNHYISPKSNLDIKVNISFRVIEEIDQNRNTVVRTLLLSDQVYWNQTKQNDSRLFTTNQQISNKSISIEINCTHYLNPASIPVAYTENEIFYQQIDPHSNKWSISVKQWPFASVTNLLRLTVDLNLSEPIKEIKENQSELVYKRFISTSHSYIQMVLPTFAFIDDSFQNLKENLYQIDKNQCIQLYFPSYLQNIEYDPHFSIRSNPGSSSTVNSTIGIFSILGIAFASLTIIGIVIAIIITIRHIRSKKKEARWKGVSF